jgi:putative colanic acid biosynthesis UDP-glucose lipid carrier transferase
MDYTLTLVALVLLAPLFLAIAIAIKLDSPGPVFFRQRRDGYNGSVIRVLKFRTMTVTEDGPVIRQAVPDDPRITRVGRFLRRTSLDELPQLFTVLSGEMSLVGPRPHAVAHGREYARLLDQYVLRHRMKPGLTGWAQVNGYRGATEDPELMRKRVEHDIYYIENWSIWLDIEILIRTVLVVLRGHNAY